MNWITIKCTRPNVIAGLASAIVRWSVGVQSLMRDVMRLCLSSEPYGHGSSLSGASRWRLWHLLGIALFVTACRPDLKNVRTSFGTPCETFNDGKMQFWGDVQCFKALPMTTISGYWVEGHEYSVFYKDLHAVPIGEDDNPTWLELSNEAYAEAEPMLRHQGDLFEVTFVGVDPKRSGYFGHLGSFKKGVYAARIVSLKEVRRR